MGLFGDGRRKWGKQTGPKGHSDFFGGDRFDFTKEDHDLKTSPVPIIGNPKGHFLPHSDQAVLPAINEAINNCDKKLFERAMHRAQDYYVHYEPGYRWDPGNTSLPCNGYGHACPEEIDADNNPEAWKVANKFTREKVDKYLDECPCPPKLRQNDFGIDSNPTEHWSSR
jgi:hypothetical protein